MANAHRHRPRRKLDDLGLARLSFDATSSSPFALRSSKCTSPPPTTILLIAAFVVPLFLLFVSRHGLLSVYMRKLLLLVSFCSKWFRFLPTNNLYSLLQHRDATTRQKLEVRAFSLCSRLVTNRSGGFRCRLANHPKDYRKKICKVLPSGALESNTI